LAYSITHQCNLLTTSEKPSTLALVMASSVTVRKAIVDTAHQLYERGLLVSTEGNLSMRLSGQRIMITPSGLPKGRLSPQDIVIVDSDGKHLQGRRRASSELPMHLFVYRSRPEAMACVHTHSPYATAFAVAGIPLPENILPEVLVFVGSIPLTAYAAPGTEAVPKSLEPYIKNSSAFLMRNHGLLTFGRSLEEAFYRHQTVERYAHILFLAHELGGVKSIPPKDIKRLGKRRGRLEDVQDGIL